MFSARTFTYRNKMASAHGTALRAKSATRRTATNPWLEFLERAGYVVRGVLYATMGAFALGLACLPVLFIEPRLSPMVVFNTTFKAYNSFILLAVPFFLLTANLMNVGGITDRLVRLSRAMVGNFPGALAQINVLLSVFFAGISGSSTADAASQGKIFIEVRKVPFRQHPAPGLSILEIPESMGRYGYKRRLCQAV